MRSLHLLHFFHEHLNLFDWHEPCNKVERGCEQFAIDRPHTSLEAAQFLILYTGENMKGIVIHSEGRILRATAGKSNGCRLSVRPVMPASTNFGEKHSQPIRFVFFDGPRPIASSSRVVLMKGRRYPNVEHWFVLPDCDSYISFPPSQVTSATEKRPLV